MGNTYPVVTVSNMELTPMQVKFQGPSDTGPSDLGGTLGNVVISAKYAKAEMKADQFGNTVLNRKVSGFNMTVTTELAEMNRKYLLSVIYPHGSLVTTGTQAFDWNTKVGDDDLSNAGVLTLHPLDSAPTDVTHDWTFYKATASAESEFVFGPAEQVKPKIVWNILPDTTKTPARFARFGDTTL